MNKKTLIGSIIAVTILIGVSFTSVVGYRCVDYDVYASPLFTIRSSRAIDEECGEFTCDYVGRGDVINLLIPGRDNNQILLQSVINKIRKMDDVTLNRFLNLIIKSIQTKNDYKDERVSKIVLVNKQMRKQVFDGHNENLVGNTIDGWYPFCFLKWIIDLISVVFNIINSVQVKYSCYRCTSRVTNCPEC
jgi:hypothetical protein